ncbi:GNAT family N-acetyltransferase [Natronomonas amylolytica]|uniref:GNAT family N-acetyltransferase n=1 Tax=Natronomonas amylolytica TaxID=3108498 RepID=UPI003008018E
MSDDAYRIDPADSDDAETMADLWVALAADQRAYGSHLDPEANRDRMVEVMLQQVVADTAFVARDGDRIVGFVTFGRESETFEQDLVRGQIHNVFVREGRRGEGIGTDLLSAAEERLVAMGVDSIALQAMATNERARAFYHRHGYRPHRIELEKPAESDSLTKGDRQE